MSLKSKICAALAVVTVAAAVLSPLQAEARPRFGHGFGVGLATGLVVGGLAAASRPAYAEERVIVAEPRRVCRLEDRFNRFGEYVRTVRVCRVVY